MRPLTKREVGMAAGGAIVAAVALAVIAIVSPGTWRTKATRTIPSDLLAILALGDQRQVEGRFSGSLYQPLQHEIARGAARRNDLALLTAAQRLKETVDRNPTPANIHAWGVAEVLLGELDEGIATLEHAADEAATVDVLNDLAVAYME